jgi:hypothetical protein
LLCERRISRDGTPPRRRRPLHRTVYPCRLIRTVTNVGAGAAPAPASIDVGHGGRCHSGAPLLRHRAALRQLFENPAFVRFADSREIARRRARPALQRQPDSPAFAAPPQKLPEKPANGGLLQPSRLSPDSRIHQIRGQFTESLRPSPRKFPFFGDWWPETGFEAHCVARAAAKCVVPDAKADA